jgi:hypothetical protein
MLVFIKKTVYDPAISVSLDQLRTFPKPTNGIGNVVKKTVKNTNFRLFLILYFENVTKITSCNISDCPAGDKRLICGIYNNLQERLNEENQIKQ